MKILPHRITEARKRANMTQRELANALGITVQAISQWENGKTDATGRLAAIAKTLQRPEEFFTDANSAKDELSQEAPTPFDVIDVIKLSDMPIYITSDKHKRSKIRSKVIPVSDGYPDNLYAVEVKEGSDRFNVGDILIFDNDLKPKKGDIAAFIALKNDDRNFIKLSTGNLLFEQAGAVIAILNGDDWLSSEIQPLTIDTSPRENVEDVSLVIAGTLVERRSFRAQG